jgi:molybdopterin-guanine dinucleotide biosynthesis protein A
MKATIGVRYFALLRELAGKSEESVSVDSGDTASQIYLQLAAKYAFPLGLSDLRVAVNDDFTTGDHPLTDGDRLVFIPPVSGG